MSLMRGFILLAIVRFPPLRITPKRRARAHALWLAEIERHPALKADWLSRHPEGIR